MEGQNENEDCNPEATETSFKSTSFWFQMKWHRIEDIELINNYLSISTFDWFNHLKFWEHLFNHQNFFNKMMIAYWFELLKIKLNIFLVSNLKLKLIFLYFKF